jgi:hypothetical protein
MFALRTLRKVSKIFTLNSKGHNLLDIATKMFDFKRVDKFQIFTQKSKDRKLLNIATRVQNPYSFTSTKKTFFEVYG